MTMGAFGGVLRVLRDYGSPLHPNPSAADYLFIPLIGSVVAIGGYVLAKTGLVVLSSAKGDTLLSPYMISLVGIISGLLAKEVVETISTRGRKILLGATQPAPQDGGGTTVDAKPPASAGSNSSGPPGTT
jgi:hypothetical protein